MCAVYSSGEWEPSRGIEKYLQLLKSEATTSPNAAVVLDGGTPHHGAELVDWTRSDSGSLLETSLTTAVLATGLNKDNQCRDQSICSHFSIA